MMLDRSNPYVSPTLVAEVAATRSPGRLSHPRSTRLLALSFLTIVATTLVQIAVGNFPDLPKTVSTAVGLGGYGPATLLALWGIFRAVVEVFQPATGGPTALVLGKGLASGLGNLLMMAVGALAALISTFGFSRGRQLRRFGRVLLPRVRASADWSGTKLEIAGAEHAPAGLAAQWRENGRTEHASVAAFARLTLDLMALGAPPRLVAAANQDALDEIRHTELCFAIGRALDGQHESPGSFPEAQRATTLPRSRSLALAKLAIDSLVDGALHEGVSARIIAQLARRCDRPAIRAALKEIAADEGRHAAHGWDVVEWCVEQGGEPVIHALRGALRFLPGEMRSSLPAEASTGAWERWGIHGHALEAEEYAAARAHLANQVHALARGCRLAA